MYNAAFLLLTTLINLFSGPQVILVTLDGVRWQEIYYGADSKFTKEYLSSRDITPKIHDYFVDEGIAIGRDVPVVASGPNYISLPGYLEITRGHQSLDCQVNSCNPFIDRSVLNWFEKPAVFSSWSEIRKTIPVNTVTIYTDIPSSYRRDKDTIDAVNDYLQCSSPDFLWVSLGDTDENAHGNNYSAYIKSLQYADQFIGSLVERFPNSFIIISTDHGRAYNFKDHGKDRESSRVWIMVRGNGIPHKGIISYHAKLSDIYPTIIDYQFGLTLPNSLLNKE